MKHLRVTCMVLPLIVMSAVAHASGGRVSYPDGSPVVGAKVQIVKDGKDKLVLATDASGRFTLPDSNFDQAFAQITASDGKDYAAVALPVAMFEGAELAVVLHKK